MIKRYELFHDPFIINCELDCETVNWFFLDEDGGKTEILNPLSFENKETQMNYEKFISAINEVAENELNIIDYAAPLEINETIDLDGFSIKRIY